MKVGSRRERCIEPFAAKVNDGLMEGTVEEEEMEGMNKKVHCSCTRSFWIALFGAPARVGGFI